MNGFGGKSVVQAQVLPLESLDKQSGRSVMVKKVSFLILLLALLVGIMLLFYPEKLREWRKDTPLEPPPTTTTLYKWQNSKGEWVVSDDPPAGDIPYQEMKYRSDANVMPLPDELKE
jgi:hypothetical protein